MNTPVLLIIFNRPKQTRALIDALRPVRPKRIYVAADGPRTNRNGEATKCAAARAVIEEIDWPCEIFKDYAETNLGCGPRPASAISWVFEHQEQAIILEDDCIPDPSFFPFCEELLEHYQDDQRIMQICGSNLPGVHAEIDESYLFSNYPLCWGWATWKRAWDLFDYEMTTWPEYRDRGMLRNVVKKKSNLDALEHHFQNIFNGDNSVWDIRWLFSICSNNGICITPRNNLISNVGFGGDATHTFNINDQSSGRSTSPATFPLIHPAIIAPDYQHDLLAGEVLIIKGTFIQKIKKILKPIIPKKVIQAYQIRKHGSILCEY